MIISSSNLSLRFYLSDGWTKENLSAYLYKGSVSIKHPEDINPYFTLDPLGSLNLERMSREHSLKRAFDDYPEEADFEFMKKHV